MIEVQLNGPEGVRRMYSGGDDVELSDVVTELVWVMSQRCWSEVVVKLSPGFKVGTTHRQLIVNGNCRYPVLSTDTTLAPRIAAVEALMASRGVELFAVREVEQALRPGNRPILEDYDD